MTVTIDLAPELEARLRDEAARQGMAVGTYVTHVTTHVLGDVNDCVQRLGRIERNSPALPAAEAELLQRINAGPGEGVWRRYHYLVAKRRAETLSLGEHAELVGLPDEVEEANARRLGAPRRTGPVARRDSARAHDRVGHHRPPAAGPARLG